MACSTRRRNQYCRDKRVARLRCDPSPFRQLAEHRHGRAAAQLRKTPAGDQLLGLDEELDLADAATTELDVVPLHGDLAMTLMRMDLTLDRMDVGDRRIVHVFAPDVGLQFLQKGFARREVAGHRTRLDHRRAFPVLAAALVVGQRGLDGDGKRRRARVRTQAKVGAEDIAMFGAVLEDAHQPARKPHEQVGCIHGIDDRGCRRIEEDDEIDVGGKVQLVRAELAHAEDDPAGAFARVFRIGQLELALTVRVEKQEVDRRVDACVGETAQPFDGRRRIGLAREIGERDQEMRFELQSAQRHHQACFADVLGTRAGGDLSEQRVQSLLDRLVEQGIEHGRLPAGAIAQEIRKVENGAEKILPLPLRGQVSRQPRQPVILGGRRDFG